MTFAGRILDILLFAFHFLQDNLAFIYWKIHGIQKMVDICYLVNL